MDKQKLFNTAWDHFVIRQSKPAVRLTATGSAQCMYAVEGDESCRCAIGIQLTPAQAATLPAAKIEHILEDLTYKGRYHDAAVNLVAWLEIIPDSDDPAFLIELQESHDEAATAQYPKLHLASIEEFRAKFPLSMKDLAVEYGLVVPAAS